MSLLQNMILLPPRYVVITEYDSSTPPPLYVIITEYDSSTSPLCHYYRI